MSQSDDIQYDELTIELPANISDQLSTYANAIGQSQEEFMETAIMNRIEAIHSVVEEADR